MNIAGNTCVSAVKYKAEVWLFFLFSFSLNLNELLIV
jgi:hypothetical protein